MASRVSETLRLRGEVVSDRLVVSEALECSLLRSRDQEAMSNAPAGISKICKGTSGNPLYAPAIASPETVRSRSCVRSQAGGRGYFRVGLGYTLLREAPRFQLYMQVLKRNGKLEDVKFDKITTRLSKLCELAPPLPPVVDPVRVASKVCQSVHDNIPTTKLDELSAEVAVSLGTVHPDYETLAARIFVSNLHKSTRTSLVEVFQEMHSYVNDNGEKHSIISDQLWQLTRKHHRFLTRMIDFRRDYEYSYFGLKTLERGYLTKIGGRIVERPQHMLARVALGIWGDDLDRVAETYNLMSERWFTHATPTLFNAGTTFPQLSSWCARFIPLLRAASPKHRLTCMLCVLSYLLGIDQSMDSIDGIYDTLKNCAKISKLAGGIGMHIHSVRGRNSLIRGTNGTSSGIIPMLRVFNNTARYVNQAGKRNGSIAVYLEPWHCDIYDFLEAKRNQGDPEARARDL